MQWLMSASGLSLEGPLMGDLMEFEEKFSDPRVPNFEQEFEQTIATSGCGRNIA